MTAAATQTAARSPSRVGPICRLPRRGGPAPTFAPPASPRRSSRRRFFSWPGKAGSISTRRSTPTCPASFKARGVDGRAITVRQLLRHQSGLPEYTDADSPEPATPRDLLARALAVPGSASGGGVAVYTNTNYIVAGFIIEAV